MKWSPTRREFLGAAGVGSFSAVGAGNVSAAGVGNVSWGNVTDVVPSYRSFRRLTNRRSRG
jgi:hypothetical protein